MLISILYNYTMRNLDYRIGKKFGYLTIIGRAEKDKYGRIPWLCKCDCGNTMVTHFRPLETGAVKSCGCYRNKRLARDVFIHGKSKTKLYNCWCGIKARCENPKTYSYHLYGGRGITFHEPWRMFKNFDSYIQETIGDPPTPQHSIDRIDNNGNYEPGNIRWATHKEQGNNQRTNYLVEFNGQTKTLSQWSEYLRISRCVLHQRLHKLQWSIEEALTTPVRYQAKRHDSS